MSTAISDLQPIPLVHESKKKSFLKLVWGTLGIYVCLLISALLNEKM
jgi:hypothetical protein